MSVPRPVIDTASLLQRVGGDEPLLHALLAMFVETHWQTVAKTRTAYESGDMIRARTIVHALKGVAGNLSMELLSSAAAALESVFKAGNSSEVEPHLRSLERAQQDVLTCLAERGIVHP